MRIAIVAPLCETVPPSKYGGTERVVHFIVVELVRLGHTVTLYAARGSKTSGKLIECFNGTFREHGIEPGSDECRDANTAQLKLVMSEMATHDIIHIHHGIDPYHSNVLDRIRTVPILWTDHNSVHNLDKPRHIDSLAKLGIGITALSESHRNTVPDAKWLATIHHGLPVNLLTPRGATPTYLAFLGRVSPEKGITTAIRISEAAGLELKIAPKVDKGDRVYYEEEVEPLVATSSKVNFIGEISDEEKNPFLSAAIALVFPICWLEPFGLVMIEAMACGCPVIAFRMGSAPEVVEDGVTGFLVDTEEEAVEALQHIGRLNRTSIRRRFEERFTSTVMAKKYVDTYERCIQQNDAVRKAKELERAIANQEANLLQRPGLFSDLRPSSLRESSLSLQRSQQSCAKPPVSTLV